MYRMMITMFFLFFSRVHLTTNTNDLNSISRLEWETAKYFSFQSKDSRDDFLNLNMCNKMQMKHK